MLHIVQEDFLNLVGIVLSDYILTMKMVTMQCIYQSLTKQVQPAVPIFESKSVTVFVGKSVTVLNSRPFDTCPN